MKAPDRIDVARHALAQTLTHPATWAPFVPIAGAYAFLGAPWWLCLPLLLVLVVVIGLLWAKRWPRLMDKARTDLLLVYRTTENAELGTRIVRVAQAGQRRPVARWLDPLHEAMDIKQAVEDRLFADGIITEHEEEVSTMIGDLVRTMVGEAERLALAEGGDVSKAAAEKFDKAASTLRRAFGDIDVILDPIPDAWRLPAENDALTRASERLDERLQQAHGVRRHLEQGMQVSAGEPSAPSSVSEASASKQSNGRQTTPEPLAD